ECTRAAKLIASAIQIGLGPLLPRQQDAMTIFIPQDSAFGGAWEQIADVLLHPNNRRLFLSFLQAHFVPSADFRERGANLPTEIMNVAMVDEPVRAAGHSIYPIRKLLASVPLARETSVEATAANGMSRVL